MITSAIVDQVVANINRSDLTRIMVLQYLNNRADQICNFDNFSFMELTADALTAASQQSYSMPTDYKDQLQLFLVDGAVKTQLKKWVGSEAEKNYTKTDTEGKPFAYWCWDDAYFLYPIPDAEYTITLKYYQYLPDMTDAASEENELCTRWADLLINGATSDAFHYFLMQDKAVEWEAKWQNEFNKLVRRQGKKRYTNYTPTLKLRIK